MLTRSAIFEHVWGYDFGSSSNSLGVYMGYLRRKTEVGEEQRLLHTVRGVGYVLRTRSELPPADHAGLGGSGRDRRRAGVAADVPAPSDQLRSQVDAQLRDRAHEASTLERFLRLRAHPHLFGRLPPSPEQVRGYQQIVNAGGQILARSSQTTSLPVDARTRSLAADGGEPFLRDVNVHGVHQRVLTESFGSGRAVQLALPLTEVDSLLRRLRLILALSSSAESRSPPCSAGSSPMPQCGRSSASPARPSTSP